MATRGRPSRESTGSRPDRRRSLAGIVALVCLAAVAYAVYGYEASVPRFLLDELYYLEAGTSLGEGHGLRFRDQAWGYGPAFPGVIALLVRLTSDQETTYALVKLVGALAFAAALAPVYLIAGRYVSSRAALGVAALTALLPSTTYVSLVMTESLSFLVVALLWLSMLLALERPSIRRQVAVLGLLAVAAALRTQLAPLALAWLGSIVLHAWLVGGRASLRERLRPWWPTTTTLAGGVVVAVVVIAVGRGADVVGSYDVLFTTYDPPALAKAFVHQLASVSLTLAAVPVLAGCVVLAQWLHPSDRGNEGALAFVAVFVPANAVLLASVSVFAASEYAVGSLHDRKLFYVYPLWLVLFGVWLVEGLPRPRWLVGAGAALVAVVALLPFGELSAEEWLPQHEAPATEIWGLLSRRFDALGVVMVAAAVVISLVVLLVPRRWRAALPAVVALTLASNLALAWRSGFVDPTTTGAGPRGTRTWVDRALPAGAEATLLVVGEPCSLLESDSALMTLFYNRTALDSVAIGRFGVAKPASAVLSPSGLVLGTAGAPLQARYVITTPAVRLAGARLATGSPVRLVLWRTPDRVRVVAVDPCPGTGGAG